MPTAMAAAIVVAILVAIVEEIFFRGLVFEGLRRHLGLRTAVLGSALLFGLAHLDLHQGVAAGLLGVQLGALRAVLGLPVAIFAHALNNTAAVLARTGGLETSAASLALAALLSITALHALTRRARAGSAALQRGSGSDESSEDDGLPELDPNPRQAVRSRRAGGDEG
jgi:membrane protease YdiL (CAAX protease family)